MSFEKTVENFPYKLILWKFTNLITKIQMLLWKCE